MQNGSTTNSGTSEGQVCCQTSQGSDVRAGLLRFTRHLAVFEIYTPTVVLQLSEALSDFKIMFGDRMAYSGRAVVRSMVDTGVTLVCEATLDDAWVDLDLALTATQFKNMEIGFKHFLLDWQRNYKILPDFKGVITDLRTFMADLRSWLEQVEAGIRSAPATDRPALERDMVRDLAPLAVPAIDAMIERFDLLVERLPEEERPVHRSFLRRQLHPLVLCSPFAYRTFYKPLGYPGDYEMVNMIVRDPYEGGSLFAKLINVWLLGQAPAQAHRNRIRVLLQRLCDETVRVLQERRCARIYSLGSGPAHEVQQFIAEKDYSENADLTLVDFNEETLQYAGTTLEEVKRRHRRNTSLHLVKRSVIQILKESGKATQRLPEQQFDFVYCAGLFDYLNDPVCRRLMNTFYEWLAPGGLLVVTNVDATLNDSKSFRHSMDFFLDWNLIYRTAKELRNLAPAYCCSDDCTVTAEDSGTNVFLEVRKPKHA